ncbi:MAG TPA: sodium:proton antiporter, partial [Thermoanaerobaculia bacterium]|nr:sodium:proton antiporter [Thermoanaerobaculia bacterium]
AVPDPFAARRMLEVARMVNPGVETIVRTHSEEESELLVKERAGKVFMGEHELALSMTRSILERVAEARPAAH